MHNRPVGDVTPIGRGVGNTLADAYPCIDEIMLRGDSIAMSGRSGSLPFQVDLVQHSRRFAFRFRLIHTARSSFSSFVTLDPSCYNGVKQVYVKYCGKLFMSKGHVVPLLRLYNSTP